MAGKSDPPTNPPAPPAPPSNQPPAPPAPPSNQPPAPPAPGTDLAAQFAQFQQSIADQIKGLTDQVAKVGQPAPRDPLAEVDKLSETVKGHSEWVARHARAKAPNWFERTFLGHRPPAPPEQSK